MSFWHQEICSPTLILIFWKSLSYWYFHIYEQTIASFNNLAGKKIYTQLKHIYTSVQWTICILHLKRHTAFENLTDENEIRHWKFSWLNFLINVKCRFSTSNKQICEEMLIDMVTIDLRLSPYFIVIPNT